MPDGLTPCQYVERAQVRILLRWARAELARLRTILQRRTIPVGEMSFVWQPYIPKFITPPFVLADGLQFGVDRPR